MSNPNDGAGISRRDFLRGTLTLVGGSVLAACAPVAAPTQAPGAPAATAPPKKVELTYAFHDPAEYRTEMVEVFTDAHPNITIELQQIPGDEFRTKVYTMATAGTMPDVVRVWEPMVLDFGRAGQVIDLQPRIDAEPGFNPGDFLESLYDFPVIGEKRYGIPDGWNGHIAFYNKDLFDEAGVSYPIEDWAWDEYVGIARQLSKPEEQLWGSDTIPIAWLHYNYKFIWQNGGQVYNEDYTKCLLDSPEAIEGLQYWADLLLEAEIMPSPAQAEGMGDLFQTGRVAMQRMGTWVIGPLAEGDFAWDMLPEPRGKERRTLVHTAFNVIPTTAENKEAAWEWLNFVVGPEGMYLYTRENATPAPRRSVNERRPWVRAGIDADWDVVPEAGEYGIVVPAPPNVGEVEKLQLDAFQAVYLGKQTAEEALTEVAPKVTEALQA